IGACVRARHFDAGVLEADVAQQREEFFVAQRAGDAPSPQRHARAHGLRQRAAHDDVAHREAPTRLEHAERLGEYGALVAERLMTQLEMMTSTELRGSGMFSMCPRRNSTFVSPDAALLAFANSSMSSVMSRPYALPA